MIFLLVDKFRWSPLLFIGSIFLIHFYSFFSVAIQDIPSGVISNYVQTYKKDFLTLSQSTNEINRNCLALENEYLVQAAPNGDEACSSIIKHINASILPNSVTAIFISGYEYFGVEIATFNQYFIILFLLKIILLFFIIKVSKSFSLINRNSTLILFIYLATILLVDRLGRGSGFYTMDPVLSVDQNLSFDSLFSYFLYQAKSTIFPLLNFHPFGNTVRSVSLLFSGFAFYLLYRNLISFNFFVGISSIAMLFHFPQASLIFIFTIIFLLFSKSLQLQYFSIYSFSLLSLIVIQQFILNSFLLKFLVTLILLALVFVPIKKREFFLKIRITSFALYYVAFCSLFPILYLVYMNLSGINIATLNKSLWAYSFFRETPGRIAVYIYTIYLLIFLFYKKDVNAKAVN
jgi:hypothetical protein